jgi:ubiquinone/menaquinone biosynthesis C-methylase UbiE
MTEPAPEQVRERVVARYSGLARSALDGQPAVDCGPDAFTDGGFGAAGYIGIEAEEALDVSLGCGNPVAIADLAAGDVVLDLGSGGGLDVLLSGRRVGPSGRVYGVDASEDMLALARRNAERAGATNVEFRHGHIENLPLPDSHVDVVISNCVVNLSTDKRRVLAEAFRVLRPGGRFGISDVVAPDDTDPRERAAAEERVGCTVGTLTLSEYLELLAAAGFGDIRITTTRDLGGGLASAIVQAVKPA